MKDDNKTYTLKDLLKDFAHDVVNHCASIARGEIEISKPGLDNLIDAYNTAYSKKSIFKWFEEERIGSPIIWPITEEALQQEAEQEIKRELTEVELNRVNYSICEEDSINWKYFTLLREIICDITDTQKNNWEELDKDFEEEMNPFKKKLS